MKRSAPLLIVLLLLGVIPAWAIKPAAATQTSVQLAPMDDAYVTDGDPTSNFGSYYNLYVGTYYKDNSNYRTYLKFNLSGLPENAIIVSATLHAYTYSGTYSREINISVYAVQNDSWSEDTITWNNKPPAGELLDKDLVGPTGKHWSVWNVTEFVKSEFSGDKVVSFVLISDSEGKVTERVSYTSKESKYTDEHPYLEIVYEVPEGPHYQSIKEIRENWADGKPVITSGVVIGTRYNGFFIQNGTEPNSGIYVYVGKSFAGDVKPGDVVQVNGTTATWNGLYEIKNPKYKVIGKAELPEPVLIKAEDMDDRYQSMLVKLEWVKVEDVDGKDIIVSDDTGSLLLHDYYGIMDVTPGKRLEYVVGIGYRYKEIEVYPIDYKVYIPPVRIVSLNASTPLTEGITGAFSVTVFNNGTLANNVTLTVKMDDEIVVNVTKELQPGEEYTHTFYYTPEKAGNLKVEADLYDDTNSLLDSLIHEFVVNPNPNSVAFGLTIRYSREYQSDLSDLDDLYANFTDVVTKLKDYGVNFDPKLAKRIEWINENYETVKEEYNLYRTFLTPAGASGFYLAPMIHMRKALFLGREVKEEITEVLPILEAALEKIEAQMVQPTPSPSPAPGNETAANQTETPSNQTTPAPSTNATTNITIRIPTVLIDASHNQYYVNKVGVNDLVENIKGELNWDVEINYEPLTYDRIKDYDVVIILNPANDLSDEEISALREYVEEGGGLIVAGDWYKYVNPSLNRLLNGYGIAFETTELMDDEDNSGRPYYPYVGVYNRNSPVTKFIPDGQKMYYNGDTLTVSGNAVWVIRAFETSYAVDADGNVVYEKGSQPIVAAAVKVGRGRIVAYGSSKGFSDSYGGKYIESTWPFIKGALLWLVGEI